MGQKKKKTASGHLLLRENRRSLTSRRSSVGGARLAGKHRIYGVLSVVLERKLLGPK